MGIYIYIYMVGSNPSLAKSPKVEFPHQVNWHSDQSYRRPPPDITLLLAVRTPPPDQGQTLVADCTSACVALNLETRERLRHLNGIHAPSWVGRSREAVEQGEPVLDLLPHQVPQQHPLLRRHPVSGEESLFVCEEKQMDFVVCCMLLCVFDLMLRVLFNCVLNQF